MYAKSLLIPIAAFALSATGVSAFNPDMLEHAGLTESQISAFEDARELREEGKLTKARDVLKGAGIDMEILERMRDAVKASKDLIRTAIDVAAEANDYDAFKIAIENSPLADVITSEDDFASFRQAREFHLQGQSKDALVILDELGFSLVHKNTAFKPLV
jgi:hypothetical protein